MWESLLATLMLPENRGKVIGIGLGLIIGILFITVGFWKTMFVIVCIVAGFFLGKKLDEKENFNRWLQDLYRGKD